MCIIRMSGGGPLSDARVHKVSDECESMINGLPFYRAQHRQRTKDRKVLSAVYQVISFHSTLSYGLFSGRKLYNWCQ